jgi:hypothetical protein
VDVLDLVTEDRDPAVLALFPHRVSGSQEIGAVENSEGDRHQAIELASDAVVNRGSALRAKMVGDLVAAVGLVSPNLRLTFDCDLLGRPAGLGREGAARPLLAVQTVTHRNPHRLTGDDRPELAAAA